jgi:hypothetical protein
MSPLCPEQWQVLSPFLDQALTMSMEECAVRLESLRTEKPEIAHELDAMLEQHRAASQEGFLDEGPALPLDSRCRGKTLVHIG